MSWPQKYLQMGTLGNEGTNETGCGKYNAQTIDKGR